MIVLLYHMAAGRRRKTGRFGRIIFEGYRREGDKLKFAFVVYDGLTLLDFAGVYDAVTRLHTMGLMDGLCCDVCAVSGLVKSFEGLEIKPTKVLPDLGGYDAVFIPGGNGIASLIGDKAFVNWLRGVREDALKVSVCGGALLWGAAGKLAGKRASTHPSMREYLPRFGATAADERVTEDGLLITARGVTSAVDLGLYLCEKLAGCAAREVIQKQMDYPYYNI
jgi:cyclohexyl-isocyanide hydratase